MRDTVFDRKIDCLTLYHIVQTFNNPRKKPFENIVGKGENDV